MRRVTRVGTRREGAEWWAEVALDVEARVGRDRVRERDLRTPVRVPQER